MTDKLNVASDLKNTSTRPASFRGTFSGSVLAGVVASALFPLWFFIWGKVAGANKQGEGKLVDAPSDVDHDLVREVEPAVEDRPDSVEVDMADQAPTNDEQDNIQTPSKRPFIPSFLWSPEFAKNVLAGIFASIIFWAAPLSLGLMGDFLKDLPALRVLSRVLIVIAVLLYLLIAYTATSQLTSKDTPLKGWKRATVLFLVWALEGGLVLVAITAFTA